MKKEVTTNDEEFDAEKAFDLCVKRTDRTVDRVMGELFPYMFTLFWYCNRVGVQEEQAIVKVVKLLQHKGIKRDKFLEDMAEYHYSDFEKWGIMKLEDVRKSKAPGYIFNMQKVCRKAAKKQREGEKWTDGYVKYCCGFSKLNPKIVRSIFVFRDEHCKNEKGIGFDMPAAKFVLENRIEIRKNALNGMLVFREQGSEGEFEQLQYQYMWRALVEGGFDFKVQEVDAFVRSGLAEEFDPFRDYFEDLPKWDGVDHITALANHVEIDGDGQSFFNEQFRKALIRNVGCGLGKSINRYVMVLSGEKQNTGKSTFIRNLCPLSLRQYYTEDELRGNKDDSFKLSETFIYNLEELSTLGNKDINGLKAYLSAGSVNLRKPYSRDTDFRIRRTNFWASTNKDQFLIDETGNTRWLVFKVNGIKWSYSTDIDINKAWAQAYHLYQLGEDGQLSKEEVQQQEKSNVQHEIRSLEHEYIQEFFSPTQKGEGEFWPNIKFMEHFVDVTKRPFNLNPYVLAKSFIQLGFQKDKRSINGQSFRGYWMKKKSNRPNLVSNREEDYLDSLPKD